MRGLSDRQLAALVESLPEGMGMLDEAAAPLWMNREARRLLALRATLNPRDTGGATLGLVIARLVAAMPAYRSEQRTRCTVEGGGVVQIVLRRSRGSQLATWLCGSAAVEAGASPRPCAGEAKALSRMELIVAEQLLEEAVVGLAVADAAGQIRWMNRQAERLLGCGQRIGGDAARSVARAARHVASGSLVAPVRLHVRLPSRAVDALFWNATPQLAGVLLREGHVRSRGRPERPTA